MIQALLGALTALVVAVLVWPLLRARPAAPPRAEFDLEVHRDQLAELERDRARGTISDDEARAARAEIGRRMLAIAGEGDAAPAEAGAGTARAMRLLAIALAFALPVAALAIYGEQGAPGLPGQPLAERRAEEPPPALEDRQLAAFARAMRERAERNPDDLEAWVRVAQASSAMGEPALALDAWRRADELAGKPPEIAGLLGETAVAAANGQVTPEAEAAFARVLAADPGDPRARYYAGLARAQAGERAAAVQIWFDLDKASPAGSPWLPTVRDALERTAREARIDLRRLRASSGNPPAAVRLGSPRVGEAPADSPAIRAMVDGLAARLETQPDDLDGWRRLARARQVLGEADKALAAHARAAAIAPDNADVLQDYAAALVDLHDPETPLDASARAAMTALLAKSPNEGRALWLLGQDEALAGKDMAATALWQRLLALLPEGNPARADLAARIEKLKTKK
jgi:cytochrome c-type biogenesis protein CcmH